MSRAFLPVIVVDAARLAAPISRTPSIVSNREHLDAIGQLLKHHVIWKSCHWEPPRLAVDKGNARAGGGKALDQLERSLHLMNEPIGDLGIFIAIPSRGIAEFPTRGGLDNERLQRANTLARRSSSTTRQSSPRSSAAIRERRSISVAQALCTSFSDSSRLASSSAASAARSSGPSVRASCRRRLVASVTQRF